VNIAWEALRAVCRQRRHQLGLTQAQLGEAMGRSQDYVSVLENNVRGVPNLATLLLWVEALGGTIRIDFQDEP